MEAKFYSIGLKSNYHEFIFLAEYYLWNYRKSNNATGFNSPIDGLKFKNNSDQAHHIAHKNACLAMAKSYLNSAKQIRESKKFNIFSKSIDCYFE